MTREQRMEAALIQLQNELKVAKALAGFFGDKSHGEFLQDRIDRIEQALLEEPADKKTPWISRAAHTDTQRLDKDTEGD